MKKLPMILAAAALAASGCGKKQDEAGSAGKTADPAGGATTPAPSGEVIRIDGSSTVFPISQAVAEDFQAANPGTKIAVAESGTGGGFKKLCRGEVDVAGASRPIKKEELEACTAAGLELIELPVAYDGLAVVVHKSNDWVDKLTVEELKTIWAPEAQGKVTKWSQVRPGFPDKDLRLVGPGVDSGTYDYFTQAIVGKEHSSRGDYTASEDDNVLVQGVASDPGALGFFGYAYYAGNQDKLKVVPIDGGKGPVAPSDQTVNDGTYQPLSRPIFIYVSAKALARPEITKLAEFYLSDAGVGLVKEVGYVALPTKVTELARKRLADKKTGTVFAGGSQVGVSLEQVLGGS